MRLLLDTHALLWALAEPHKLSPQALSVLQVQENELWVSSISLFEIATKVRLGKLLEPGNLLKQWGWTLSKLGASLLPLSGMAAVRAGSLATPHRDPFDRLLAAQAIEEELHLITCDAAFGHFHDLQTLW